MKGRKVIPISTKKAKGTHRKHRDRESPNPSTERPLPPSHLSKRAKQIFNLLVKRMDELQNASRSFTIIIALLASRMEEIEKLDRIIEREGQFYNSGGLVKSHPAVQIRDRAARHVHALTAECGLTPVAIQKIGVRAKKQGKNTFGDL